MTTYFKTTHIYLTALILLLTPFSLAKYEELVFLNAQLGEIEKGTKSHKDLGYFEILRTTDRQSKLWEKYQELLQPLTDHAARNELERVYTLLSKARGAVLGAAVGDAIGRLTEFKYTHKDLEGVFGSAEKISLTTYPSIQILGKKKIIYTDDTVMSKVVLEDAIKGRKEEWDNREIVRNITVDFCWWLDPLKDPLYDARKHGTQNEAALPLNLCEHTLKGPSWEPPDFGVSGQKAGGGCGSVMRAWPIGLVFADDATRIIELAELQSKITHQNPMAYASCAAIAAGVAAAFAGKEYIKIIQGMIDAAVNFNDRIIKFHKENYPNKNIPMKNIDHQSIPTHLAKDEVLPSDLLRYAAFTGMRSFFMAGSIQMLLDASKTILGEKNDKGGPGVNYRSETGSLLGWAADEAVAAALYFFAQCHYRIDPGSTQHTAPFEKLNYETIIWQTMQAAAWTVGDSDSIASLTGALLGAYYGMRIPENEETAMVDKLENYDKLLALADEVAEIFVKHPLP